MNDDASGRKARAKTQFNTVAAEYDAGPGCFAHFGRRCLIGDFSRASQAFVRPELLDRIRSEPESTSKSYRQSKPA